MLIFSLIAYFSWWKCMYVMFTFSSILLDYGFLPINNAWKYVVFNRSQLTFYDSFICRILGCGRMHFECVRNTYPTSFHNCRMSMTEIWPARLEGWYLLFPDHSLLLFVVTGVLWYHGQSCMQNHYSVFIKVTHKFIVFVLIKII